MVGALQKARLQTDRLRAGAAGRRPSGRPGFPWGSPKGINMYLGARAGRIEMNNDVLYTLHHMSEGAECGALRGPRGAPGVSKRRAGGAYYKSCVFACMEAPSGVWPSHRPRLER